MWCIVDEAQRLHISMCTCAQLRSFELCKGALVCILSEYYSISAHCMKLVCNIQITRYRIFQFIASGLPTLSCPGV